LFPGTSFVVSGNVVCCFWERRLLFSGTSFVVSGNVICCCGARRLLFSGTSFVFPSRLFPRVFSSGGVLFIHSLTTSLKLNPDVFPTVFFNVSFFLFSSPGVIYFSLSSTIVNYLSTISKVFRTIYVISYYQGIHSLYPRYCAKGALDIKCPMIRFCLPKVVGPPLILPPMR